jgi:predicted transcriptional regulator
MQAPLELETRRRIFELVSSTPGIHFSELKRRLGLATGMLVYHLDYLQKQGIVYAEKKSFYKRYYPTGKLTREEKSILSMLRLEIPRAIVLYLLNHPNTTHKQLLSNFDISGATLSYHLKNLVENGIVSKTIVGKKSVFAVRDEEKVAKILITYKESFYDLLVDKFIKFWTTK